MYVGGEEESLLIFEYVASVDVSVVTVVRSVVLVCKPSSIETLVVSKELDVSGCCCLRLEVRTGVLALHQWCNSHQEETEKRVGRSMHDAGRACSFGRIKCR
jgi:hypothetical protein